MLCLTSKPDNLSACSRIAVTSRHLARLLKSTPDSLRKDVNAALSDHIPDTVLPSLSSVQSVEERRLLASAQSALRIHTFLMNADGIKWHASTRSTWSARAIGCFFLECCARILPREIEDLLQMIRKSVRKYKDPGSVTQHSFAIYYRILTDLRQWTKTRSALDSIMEPLIARAHEVLDDLGSLYQTKYRSSTTLEGFAQESIPPTPNNITLHFSHELLTPNDNTAKPWDPSSNDPFRKDFWIFLPTLLVLDGKYSWISTTQFAALGAPSSKKIPITNVGTFETETSESDPSQLPNSSQDLTLVDSPWDDRSTYVQSPGDLRQLVEASDDHQVEHGDVKTPRELYWMHTEDTAGPLKRNLSPVSSESSRRSPVPKRSELDGWQSGNQFEEVYFEIMASRQSPSP